MKKVLLWMAIAALVVGGAYFAWDWYTQAPPPKASAPVKAAAPPPAPAAPAIHYEIEPPAVTPPLDLEGSDEPFGTALTQLLGKKSLPGYFHPDKMIRRIVATVDNLPRKQVSQRLMPVKPVAGRFAVTGAGNELAIDPANSARYDHYVSAFQAVDVPELVDVYIKFYPLFQRAYQELGYPSGYFNDRLVEALDDLLAAPDVPAPVPLTQAKVLFEFADPELEARSAGQKIMMRMGGAKEKQTKAVLRVVRDEVTRRAVAR